MELNPFSTYLFFFLHFLLPISSPSELNYISNSPPPPAKSSSVNTASPILYWVARQPKLHSWHYWLCEWKMKNQLKSCHLFCWIHRVLVFKTTGSISGTSNFLRFQKQIFIARDICIFQFIFKFVLQISRATVHCFQNRKNSLFLRPNWEFFRNFFRIWILTPSPRYSLNTLQYLFLQNFGQHWSDYDNLGNIPSTASTIWIHKKFKKS